MKVACATSTSRIASARRKSRPKTRVSDMPLKSVRLRPRSTPPSCGAANAPAARDPVDADAEPQELEHEGRKVERIQQRQQHRERAECIHQLTGQRIAARASGLQQQV